MKRVFALILALCMACALFACGKKQTEVAPGGDSPTVTPGATAPDRGPAPGPVPVRHHLSGLSHLVGHRAPDHQHLPGQL